MHLFKQKKKQSAISTLPFIYIYIYVVKLQHIKSIVVYNKFITIFRVTLAVCQFYRPYKHKFDFGFSIILHNFASYILPAIFSDYMFSFIQNGKRIQHSLYAMKIENTSYMAALCYTSRKQRKRSYKIWKIESNNFYFSSLTLRAFIIDIFLVHKYTERAHEYETRKKNLLTDINIKNVNCDGQTYILAHTWANKRE